MARVRQTTPPKNPGAAISMSGMKARRAARFRTTQAAQPLSSFSAIGSANSCWSGGVLASSARSNPTPNAVPSTRSPAMHKP
jgi:hypothetical protein